MSIDLVIALVERLDEVAADNECRVVVLTGAGRAFCSGLDLKDYGIIPNIDGLSVGRIAQPLDALLLAAHPADALHAPAGHRRGQRPGLRRRHVPRRSGPTCGSRRASAEFNATGHRQRAHLDRDGDQLPPAPPHRRGALQRLAPHRSTHRRGRGATGWAWSRGSWPTTSCSTPRSRWPRGWRASRPTACSTPRRRCGPRSRSGRLAAAIEFEDRNQLMLGFTDNLPEAIRSFAADREPTYLDEPRRDIWGAGRATDATAASAAGSPGRRTDRRSSLRP